LKKVAILQSNYIPWKGYFDLIAYVDEFIIYDEVQYTKNDWRNRNQIKTPTGLQWLTVPVKTKHCSKQKVSEASIANKQWQIKHWTSLENNYASSSFFKEIYCWLKPLFLERTYSFISEVNRVFIEAICSFLKINTKISCSSNFNLIGEKSERLANICQESGATEYVSGPSAKNYIDLDVFNKNNIHITWFNYDSYQQYPQLWGEFRHEVSILDLLFNCGKNSHKFMKFI
jgi:hypothetical protein